MRILKNRRKLMVLVIIAALIILVPVKASAAFSVNINISRQDGGEACGELWLGDELFWRLLILPDGVRPALSRVQAGKTTFITPAIVDGMFVINIK